MNNRANIMYFFEALCDRARHEQHPEFIRMMERDILKIIDLVAPDDGSGAANVKVVRRVLHSLQQKTYLDAQTVVELEECIKDRDKHGAGVDDEADGGVVVGAAGEDGTGKDAGVGARGDGAGRRQDKRQIEQRIEEDRERHKRLRESIWAQPHDGPDAEFWRMMEETSDADEDDYALAAEEAEERRRCAVSHRLEFEGRL